MTRAPSPTDYFSDIEGIGRFRFAKRQLADEFAIGVQIRKFNGGLDVDLVTASYIEAVATLMVLTVEGPPGWGPDEIMETDLYEPTAYDNLMIVWKDLLNKEESFRTARAARRNPSARVGEEAGDESRVLVPPAVQPAADRPPLPAGDEG